MEGTRKASAFACHMAGSARIGLGCMALTGLYGEISVDQATATIHRALAKGVRLFDTAAIYGDGANEKLLGRTLAERKDVFIATKFGLARGKGGRMARDSSPSTIRLSVERSLRRLRRDRVDLLLQHRRDPRVTDDDVAGAVADLIHEGKVAAFGLSSTDSARASELNREHPVHGVQNELSVIAPPSKDAMPSAFGAVGAAYMAYSPLGRGLLSSRGPGRVLASDDYRARLELFKGGRSDALASVLDAIEDVATRHGVGRTAVSLAWTLACGANVVAIPGARSPVQVDGALEGCRVRLDERDVRQLNAVGVQFVATAGTRG